MSSLSHAHTHPQTWSAQLMGWAAALPVQGPEKEAGSPQH